MSNSAYSGVNASNEELNELLSSDVTPAPKKSNVLYRLLAFVFAVAPIVLLCILPMPIMFYTTAGFAGTGLYEDKLTGILIGLFTNKLPAGAVVDKLFNFLPVFAYTEMDILMWIYTVAFYGMLVCLVISFVLAFIAVISGKAAPALARAIAWINFWAVGGYMLSLFTNLYFLGELDFVALLKIKSFLVPVCTAAGLAFFGFILSVVKAPKKVWVSTLLFIFAVAFNIVCVYSINYFSILLADEKLWEVYLYAMYAFLGVSGIAMVTAAAMLGKKKGFGGNLFATILQLLCALAALAAYICNMQLFKDAPLVLGDKLVEFNGVLACLIALGALAILGMIISIIRMCISKKAEAARYVAEHGITKEEAKSKDYIEAVPYRGSYARMTAEEVEAEAAAKEEEDDAAEETPATYVASTPAATATANDADDKTKIDDEFIATLTAEERKQFADIFMLKSKGEFDGIPDYKTGEDNKEFFRKIFVKLGQYRARIPDELLGKIYDFYTDKY